MSSHEALLDDIRVLDLSDEKGVYCTKLLADLGADVLRIEPPGGHPMRNLGPFVDDEPDPEKSLYWFHFNTSKRGITLNLENADGQHLFKQLVKTADVIVETYPPGYMDKIGLGYAVLQAVNPQIILTSITPFGQTGPHRNYEGSDIVAQAMGGLMNLAGFPEDPPHMIGCAQAYHSASVEGAVGTMVALYAREETGQGQQVDVSLQESVLLSMETAMPSYNLKKRVGRRAAREEHLLPGLGIYECKDGYVFSYIVAGFGAGWDVILDWMESENMVGDLKDPKFDEIFELTGDMQKLQALTDDTEAFLACLDDFAHIIKLYAEFLATKTKTVIFDEASERRIMITPVQNAKDIVKSAQFEALGFFTDVEHPELGRSIKYPGPPYYHISDMPWRISRRAPLIGEHNLEVYEKELGMSKAQLVLLKNQGTI